jgi:hypothetical protein
MPPGRAGLDIVAFPLSKMVAEYSAGWLPGLPLAAKKINKSTVCLITTDYRWLKNTTNKSIVSLIKAIPFMHFVI